MDWYQENKRVLPWRFTNDPYAIWLSEIILQQTRVDQGLPYYNRFIENYPRVALLAKAPEDEVFKLWQGLGYYNRARNLQETAKRIVDEFGGVFPTQYEDVISLKGIGEYTAAAIMSFAYNAPYAAVDGNVYRVLSRVFGLEDYIDTSAGKRVFQELANELLDPSQAGLFNQAMMDFGSLQCTPKSPDCSSCPFSESCIAYNNGLIDVLPQKRGKVSVRNRYFNYLDMRIGGYLFLKKRVGKDIWQNLYELPLIESSSELTLEELIKTNAYINLLNASSTVSIVRRETFKHVLSHQVIYATFYQVHVDLFEDVEYTKVYEEDVESYGVSRLIHRYFEKIELVDL